MNKKNICSYSITYFLLAIAAFLFAFGYFPGAVENVYSNNIYPIIAGFLRLVTGLFPFAVGDFLYLLLIATALFKLVKFILKKEKNYKKLGLVTLNTLLVIYVTFKLLWGLNYARPRINQQLNISDNHYKKEQLLKLSEFFLHKLDSLGANPASATAYNVDSLKSLANQAYANLANTQPFFTYKFSSVKPVASNLLISKVGIEGYYNPLSGEANVNHALPAFVLPFVTCHEIAHQIGVAKEDEANLVGYLTAVNSTNAAFKYSAYYNMLRYVLFEIRIKYPEDYNIIITKIPTAVLANFKTERDFWAQYNGAMSVYMGKTFDKILKLNSQAKGINSYQDIVLWLYNYHKKDL